MSEKPLSAERVFIDNHGLTGSGRVVLKRVAIAAALVGAASLLRILLLHTLGMKAPFVTFYPAVILAALYGGIWAGVLASIFSTFLVDFLLLVPADAQGSHDTSDWLSVAVFLAGCGFILWVIEGRRKALERYRKLEEQLRTNRDHLEELVNQRTDILQLEIAERRAVEEKLLQISELQRMTLEAAEMGAWNYRFDTGLVSWDESCRRIWGIPGCENVSYAEAIARVHAEDRTKVENALRGALSGLGDGSCHSVFRVIWTDGSVHWISAHGRVYFESLGERKRPASFVGAIREITQIKLTEERLMESSKRLRLALEAANAGTWEWDMATGRNFWSDELWKVFGLEPHACEANYDNWLGLVHPDDREGVLEVLKEAVGREAEVNMEWRVTDRDGSLRWLMSRGQPQYNGAGKVDRYIGIVIDVTERKNSQEQLRRAKEELEQRVAERTEDLKQTIDTLMKEIAERQKTEVALHQETIERLKAMEELRARERLLIQQSRHAAMGEMIGNIAHQWRQPLNSLALCVQSLQYFYDSGRFNREFLTETADKAMTQIRHMSRTIDDFRDFFKPDREKSSFSVVQAVTHAVSLVEAGMQAHFITLDLETSGDPRVTGYQNEFSQVVLNILTNARDVLLERAVANPRVKIRSFREADLAVVTLSDNGGGIGEELLEKIFDPYFTTKGPDLGTGIGLFMAKVIIEKNMGGRLMVRNVKEGAEFRIEVLND